VKLGPSGNPSPGGVRQGSPNRLVVVAGRAALVLFLFLFLTMTVDDWLNHFGISRAMMLAALARFSWLYASAAIAGLLTVTAGLAYEAFAPAEPWHGPFGAALNRLTNRPALAAPGARFAAPELIDAEAISARLKARVVGQDAVCDDLTTQIRRRLALAQRDKPVGVFLLAGPPGTGKSYLAKRLAAELGRKLLAFDMPQFAHASGANMLFGAPKGYIGSGAYGALTSGLQQTPDAVVLLDEIEKADPEVHKRFLTAWNDGYVTELSDGQNIPATQAIFMLTSNAATGLLMDGYNKNRDNPDEIRRVSMIVLGAAGFAPELLNRIDRVFVFHTLTGADIARVAVLEIEAVVQAYGLKVAQGGIDPALLTTVLRRQQGLGASASARDMARSIEDTISDALITAKQNNARTVALIANNGRIIAESAD
jgi:ATP-dependent Clp protease ATP-binding subunit ClpA